VSDLPLVAVVMPTFQRTDYAVRCLQALGSLLAYSGEIGYYIADAGSHSAHVAKVVEAAEGMRLLGWHTATASPGHNWNMATQAALAHSDILMWVEEDFELKRPLDITPYVELLLACRNVGMVRLGLLAINLTTTSVGHDGRHYLRMHRSMQYAFSGHPHLKTRGFIETYGPYNEVTNPGDTEIDYDTKFRSVAEGPDIWWPVDLGGWGVFGHIGEYRSY